MLFERLSRGSQWYTKVIVSYEVQLQRPKYAAKRICPCIHQTEQHFNTTKVADQYVNKLHKNNENKLIVILYIKMKCKLQQLAVLCVNFSKQNIIIHRYRASILQKVMHGDWSNGSNQKL